MNDRDIRAMLRGAVKAKVLQGWYWTGSPLKGRPFRYIVNPAGTTTSTFSVEEAVAYCEMLAAAGVEPVYRNPAS